MLWAIGSHAQIKHMFDTIRYDTRRDKHFFLGLDGKNSVISDEPVKMFGLQAGYLYNERTNFYVGYYASYNDANRVIILENPTATAKDHFRDSNTLMKQYSLAYFNFGCEYYFHNSRKWRFSLVGAAGIGLGSDKVFKTYKTVSNKVSGIIPLELGMNASYKLTWWLWVTGGIGTRVSFVTTKYNGPYYTLGLSLQFGEIYQRVKKLVWKKR